VAAALRELFARGLRSLMVEGGSELLGAFLAERLFDRVALFRAPMLLGGRNSRPAFGGPDPGRLSEAVRVTRTSPLLRGRAAPEVRPLPEPGQACELWYRA
jgi:diaminohydroxyphosphoribosylaminopyrimidine deaminase/5-amino-6-(5-phosphoribosylamino)uracil reductase